MEIRMRKRLIAVICTLVLLVGLTVMSTGLNAKASDEERILDGSRLTNKIESTNADTQLTRGENLQFGYSKIRKVDAGVIYAGGSTIADHTCKSVKISVIVERAKWDDEEWEIVTSWRKENTDADLVSTSKRLEVEGDWYYRVRCTHSADGDMSSSITDGLYVEKP